jgi:death-on-curing protein
VTEWRWLSAAVVEALHDRQLAEHGGPAGVRDRGMLESALARPMNQAAHRDPDAADLAAAYAFGLARNHAFVDGNKRIAWVAARVFLRDNGFQVQRDPTEAYETVMKLAAGELPEAELALWFRERLTPADA